MTRPPLTEDRILRDPVVLYWISKLDKHGGQSSAKELREWAAEKGVKSPRSVYKRINTLVGTGLLEKSKKERGKYGLGTLDHYAHPTAAGLVRRHLQNFGGDDVYFERPLSMKMSWDPMHSIPIHIVYFGAGTDDPPPGLAGVPDELRVVIEHLEKASPRGGWSIVISGFGWEEPEVEAWDYPIVALQEYLTVIKGKPDWRDRLSRTLPLPSAVAALRWSIDRERQAVESVKAE